MKRLILVVTGIVLLGVVMGFGVYVGSRKGEPVAPAESAAESGNVPNVVEQPANVSIVKPDPAVADVRQVEKRVPETVEAPAPVLPAPLANAPARLAVDQAVE